MSYVNKIRKGAQEYDVRDGRIPKITPADEGSCLTVDEEGRLVFAPAEGNGAALVSQVAEGTATEVRFSGVTEGVRDNLFEDIETIDSLELGTINGPIGTKAFYGLTNVNHFSMDPASVVTELKSGCFAGIGMDRNSTERFVFDFRNSEFTNLCGFGLPGTPASTDSGTGEIIVPAVPGLGLYNAEIYLLATVVTLAPSPEAGGSGSGGGSGGVLNSSENVDVWFTGTNVPTLDDINSIPTDPQSHIYVPYTVLGDYKLATNWVSLENLYGYSDSIPESQNLPIMDSTGFAITWYADKALTEMITVSTGGTMFCVQETERLSSRVVLSTIFDGTLEISYDGHTVGPNDLIPIGTEITITPVHDGEGAGVLTLFKVNDTDYTSVGTVTLTLTDVDVTVDVVYDIPVLPGYLTVSNNQPWNPSAPKDIIQRGPEALPEGLDELIVYPRYVVAGYINEITKVGNLQVWDNLRRLVIHDGVTELVNGPGNFSNLEDVVLPSTLKSIGSDWFKNCTSLTSINIPESVSVIDTRAFAGCTSLVNFSYASTMDDWADISLGTDWYNGSGISSIHCTDGDIDLLPSWLQMREDPNGDGIDIFSQQEIPNSVTNLVIKSKYIYNGEVRDVTSISSIKNTTSNSTLVSVSVPGTATYIGPYAFYGCAALVNINYGGSKADWMSAVVGENWKSGDTHLEVIYCADGNLYIVPYGFMMAAPSQGEPMTMFTHQYSISEPLGDFILRESYLNYKNENCRVLSIGSSTFSGKGLTSISLPDGLLSIGDEAISSNAITSITIPASLTSIGARAFYSCTELTEFNYDSTMDNWGRISLGTVWNGNCPFTVIHCTDGDVSIE